jgi:glyoxylase-like metal-dependent hydrolase (beta-lactamase superfamily II)
MTTGHVTTPAAGVLDRLPGFVTLVRCDNPGPMTLDGTNTWVLRAAGESEAVVIDPGPLDEGHLERVAERRPIGVVLGTHRHDDHVEGLPRFVELTDARRTGEVAGLSITTIPTPGHTADSVCFLVEADGERVIFTGDTILGRGTTVVAPPDGALGPYLDSLELLTAYDRIPALPGHGPALADCAAAARFYLAHRKARLDQVRDALAAGAKTARDVVAMVYADVDRSLWPAAEWTVRAQLEYLGAGSGESSSMPPGLDRP